MAFPEALIRLYINDLLTAPTPGGSGSITPPPPEVDMLESNSITISASELQNLQNTPRILVPPQGAGKIIVPYYLSVQFVYAPPLYTIGNSPFAKFVVYPDIASGATAEPYFTFDAGIVSNVSNQLLVQGMSFPADLTTANKLIYVTLLDGFLLTGQGSLVLTLYYTVLAVL